MTVIYKTGDLFTSNADVLGHGVNTMGVMGAGIARDFKSRFPENYKKYREACLGSGLKPGSCLLVKSKDIFIANIASQDLPGANADLLWLEQGLTSALMGIRTIGKHSISIPRIGTGIGGLKWNDVKTVVENIGREHPEMLIEVWTL